MKLLIIVGIISYLDKCPLLDIYIDIYYKERRLLSI
nr:MAG TPA: hypothetical protein [Caudoviricetes sp.]